MNLVSHDDACIFCSSRDVIDHAGVNNESSVYYECCKITDELAEAAYLVSREIGHLGREIVDHCKKHFCWVASQGIGFIDLTIGIDHDGVVTVVDGISQRPSLSSRIARGLFYGLGDLLQGCLYFLESSDGGVGGSNLFFQVFDFL